MRTKTQNNKYGSKECGYNLSCFETKKTNDRKMETVRACETTGEIKDNKNVASLYFHLVMKYIYSVCVCVYKFHFLQKNIKNII